MRFETPEYVIITPSQTQARMTPSKLGNTENYPLIVDPLRPDFFLRRHLKSTGRGRERERTF